MPDDFDRTTDLVERERESCIERARREVSRMLGPAECLRCGLTNDRRMLGYSVCIDCMGESDGSAKL